MDTPYPLGKLPAAHLSRLLARYETFDPRVVLGPGVGRDAAVISFGERYLVAKSDPVTFAGDEVGWYAVHVNANDVACTGAVVRWFLATLLLPEGRTDAALVDAIMGQISSACCDLNVALVGGHTEITHGLDRPIVVGCMLGEVSPGRLVRPDGAEPDDVLLLTKGIAVEGTAIVARERADALSVGEGAVDEDLLRRARRFLYEPGISVVRDASVATRAGEVHAMHDPTEGGLATGLWELAEAAGVELEVEEAALPVLPETQALCEPLGLDPLGLIASGALLLAVAPRDAGEIVAALGEEGIAAARIGRVVGRGAVDAGRKPGVVLRGKRGERPLRRFERDEIARLFEG